MYALNRNAKKLTFGATEFFHYNPLQLIGNVKTLELKGVFLHHYSNDNSELVMNFPLVEDLLLEHCGYCNVRRLIINAPKLKIFCLDSYEMSLNHSTVIRVSAPKLLGLRCNGFMFKGYRFEDLSAVYIVWFDTTVNPSGVPEMDAGVFSRCLNNFFKGLPNVRYLTLSAQGLQSFPELPDIYGSEQVSCRSLKFLKLKMIRWSKKFNIRPLAKMLNYFPNLETLVLEKKEEPLSESGTGETKEADWESQLSFECSLSHLKFVECHDLEVCEEELDFLAFLLRNAPILEKISISMLITAVGENGGEAEFCSRLFSLPQLSPSVAISHAFVGIV